MYMCVRMCVWRPKEGLVSCYYFISKSLLPSAKALFFFQVFFSFVQNIQTLFIFVQPVKYNHVAFLILFFICY